MRYRGIHRYLVPEGGRWAMSSYELRSWLGLPAKLPPDFSASITKGGLDFVVFPKSRRGMEKRVFVRCPECSGVNWVEAGHLHQHVEAHHS